MTTAPDFVHIPAINSWLFKIGPVSKLLRECELSAMSNDDFRAFLRDMTVLPETEPFDPIAHEFKCRRRRNPITGHWI